MHSSTPEEKEKDARLVAIACTFNTPFFWKTRHPLTIPDLKLIRKYTPVLVCNITIPFSFPQPRKDHGLQIPNESLSTPIYETITSKALKAGSLSRGKTRTLRKLTLRNKRKMATSDQDLSEGEEPSYPLSAALN